MIKSIKSVTAGELITHLQKFNKDAIVQIFTDEDAKYTLATRYALIDTDAPFSEEYVHEVSIFIGDVI